MRALALAAIVCAGCTVEPLDFSTKQCPCDDGLVCLESANRCVPPTDAVPGLIGWWTFDDDLGDEVIDDASGMGHEARCAELGCPGRTAGPEGEGDALALDGTPRNLWVGDDGGLSTPDALTIALWLRADDVVRSAAVVKAHGADGATVDAVSWAIELDAAGRVAFTLGDETGAHARVWSEVGAVAQGQWVHVAGTWQGAVQLLFVGGDEVGAGSGAATFGRGDLLLGGDGAAPPRLAFPGAIDDVRLYDRALGSDEVAPLAAR